MGARSDAATDRITRASAPSMAAITFCGWFQIVAASAGSFNPIARFHTASGDASSWIIGFKGANGRTPSVYSPSNTSGISAAEQALSTYVFLAATLSGTAAALHYRNVGGSMTKVTGTVAAAGTPDRITMFGRSAADGSEWLNGIASLTRLWTSVLTDSEILAESNSSTAVKSGAWGNWPFGSASLLDVSGNARDFTAGSTALASAADPSFGTALGRATETDSVPGLVRSKIIALGRAIETDSTSALGRTKSQALGRAVETDTASGLGRSKLLALGRANETDSAAALARQRTSALGRAVETDTVSAVGRSKILSLGQALETDTAAQLARTRSTELGRAQETDSALAALQRSKSQALGRAEELDSVSGFSTPGEIDLDTAVERDSVFPLQRTKVLALGRAVETDEVSALARAKTITLGRAVERDTVSGIAGEVTVDVQTLRAGASVELAFVEVGEPVTVEIVHAGGSIGHGFVEVGQPRTP